MNKVILMGRLTKDPVLNQTPQGTAFCRFGIAVQRRFSKDNQADFLNCTAWGKTADFVNNWFSKGSMIAVVGSIQTRTWDGQDGKKQYATEINVEEAYFAGSKNEQTGGGENEPQDDGEGFDSDNFEIVGNDEDLPF